MHALFLILAACGGAPAEAPVAAAPAVEAPAAHGDHAEPAAAAPVAEDGAWATYGDAVPALDVVAAATLLDGPQGYVDQTVLVEGEVADVCQKAGCWMVVADGDRTMRIRMKDHAFSVPKDCTGKTARIHGTVVAKTIDPADVAHFEGEAARPEVMPEKGREGTTYELIASAVQLPR